MDRKKRLMVAAGVVTTSALLGAGAIIQGVGASDDADGHETETPITGEALQRASAAALAATGEGQVTGTEVGDEESYYEVEVTLPDGTEVDVQLDESFHVVETN